MNIFERLAGHKEHHEALTLKDLDSQGGPQMIVDALQRVYPAFPLNFDKKDLLSILNEAEITAIELDELVNTNIRSLEPDEKNKLDYDEKFYSIRERIVEALDSGKIAA